MRLPITVFLLFLSLFYAEVLLADNLPTPEPASKCAPLLTESFDSISIVPLQSTNDTLFIKNYCAVEDTVLPPCDILFFKSGKLEYCKIIETTPTNISYKMCDYVDGPTIIVNKSTVQKIRYANGREEIVDADKDKPTVNAYVKPHKDPLATLSLIFGVSAASIILLFGIALIPLILAALILGIISLAKISRRKGELRGKGSAIAGIVLASAIIVAFIIIILLTL